MYHNVAFPDFGVEVGTFFGFEIGRFVVMIHDLKDSPLVVLFYVVGVVGVVVCCVVVYTVGHTVGFDQTDITGYQHCVLESS